MYVLFASMFDNMHNKQLHEQVCMERPSSTCDMRQQKKQMYMQQRWADPSVRETIQASDRKCKALQRSDSDFSQQENEQESKHKWVKWSQADVHEQENEQERKCKQVK